jgi:hypothetical protein
LNLAAPDIRASAVQTGDAYRITLAAAHPALRTWISLIGMDARYSDNFVNIRPSEPVTIWVHPAMKMSPTRFRKALQVRSLYDTYLHTEAQPYLTTPEPDGTIVATADKAEIEGNTAVLESGTPDDVGDWADKNDYLQWAVKRVVRGTYSVSISLSCPPGVDGSGFVVDVAGKQLSGAVPATAGWTDYTDMPLGTVHIPKSGTKQIVLKPTSMPSSRVMNLRSITLRPISGQ